MISDSDRTLIGSPAAKNRRLHLVTMLTPLRPQLKQLTNNAPSYVVDALEKLLMAFDQWGADERTLG